MIGSFKRRASRIGLFGVKTLINVDIVELSLPTDSTISEGTVLSICFERGGKIASTSNITYAKENLENNNPLQKKIILKSVAIPIYESVALVATLYKDAKSGLYQEKTGKIILRQLRKSSKHKNETYKGLGIYDLPIHDLANELQNLNLKNNTASTTLTRETTLNFELLRNTSLKVIITVELLEEQEDGLDNVSNGNEHTDAVSSRVGVVPEFDPMTAYMLDDHILPQDDNETIILGATFDTKDSPDHHTSQTSNLVNSKQRKSRMSFMLTNNEKLNFETESSNAEFDPTSTNELKTPDVRKRTKSMERKKQLLANKQHMNSSFKTNENVKITSHSLSGLFAATFSADQYDSAHSAIDANSLNVEHTSSKDRLSHTNILDNYKSPSIIDASYHDSSDEEHTGRGRGLSEDSIVVDSENIRSSILNRDDVELYSSTIRNSIQASAAAASDAASISQRKEGTQLDFNDDVNADLRDDTVEVVDIDIDLLNTSMRSVQTEWTTQDRNEDNGEFYDGDSVNESHSATSVNGQSIRKSKLRIRKVTANKEAFRLYHKELAAKTKRVERLERELAEQATAHQTALLALHTQLNIYEIENTTLKDIINNQTAAINDEANESGIETEEARLLTVTHPQEIVSENTQKTDAAVTDGVEVPETVVTPTIVTNTAAIESLSVLSTPRSERTLSVRNSSSQFTLGADEYLRRASVRHASVERGLESSSGFADFAKVTAELHTIKEEVLYLKNALQMAQRDKLEETAAAREAATEAVRANMRRADLQQENEEILEELINIKVQYANLSNDLDQQLLLNHSLQRRLQIYAEKLTRLEVTSTNRKSMSAFDAPSFRETISRVRPGTTPSHTPFRDPPPLNTPNNVVYTSALGEMLVLE